MFFSSKSGFEQMGPHDAASRDDLLIVDVREDHELVGELGHIDGCVHLPMGAFLAQGLPSDVAKDTPVLLVCRSGMRSARCAQDLANRGFDRVYNLDGGMIAWGAASLPITHVAP